MKHATPTVPASYRAKHAAAAWPALLVLVVAMGLAGRWVSGWTAPLSFDETFAGVIATQRDAAGLFGWLLREMSGPAYYLPMWAWEKLAGSSNVALRAPSLILSLAAPAIILWRGHRNRAVRRLWAILMLLWLPGLSMATEARPYASLAFFACMQAIAFVPAARAPTTARALVWATISAAMILTHYYTLPVCGLQGLALVALHRRRMLACWPAALPFVVVAAWMSVHLPAILAFGRAGGSFYVTLSARDIALVPVILFGSVIHGTILLALAAVALPLAWRRGKLRQVTPEIALVAAGVGAFAFIFGMGFVHPSFALRYLTSTVPSILFGFAWWSASAWPRDRRPAVVLVAMLLLMAAGVIRDGIVGRYADDRAALDLERPSAWLMERRPTRLVFFWDSVIGAHAEPAALADVAAFHFRRSGHDVPITIVQAAIGVDTNAAVLKAAGNDPGVAILWRTSDVMLDQRYAARHPAIGAPFTCRSFYPTVGMLACRP